MTTTEIHNFLLDEPSVCDISVQENKQYKKHSYLYVITCGLVVETTQFPLIIGIPEDWEQNLFDFYIGDDFNRPFLPHVETNNKLCLFDLEGALIDQDFLGLLGQCIHKAITLLSDGLNEKNKIDLIHEFSSYWNALPNSLYACCIAQFSSGVGFLRYVLNPSWKSRSRKFPYEIFISEDCSAFSDWGISETQRIGGFICLSPKEFLYPPDPRQKLSLSFVNNLLQQVPSQEIRTSFRKIGCDKLLVFLIHQIDGTEALLGVYATNSEFVEEKDHYRLQLGANSVLQPLSLQRIDPTYLLQRTAHTSNSIHRCLIIGCGSIGGYLANQLAQSGIRDFTLIDPDRITPENIYRHSLGRAYIGQYKAEALSNRLQTDIPNLKIKSIPETIQYALENYDINFAQYSIIVSTTGNHNVNRWIKRELISAHIQVPTFYVWNEPLDLGCHVAIINNDGTASYENLFYHDSTSGDLYDLTAYCAPGQKITHQVSGCSNSFVPYAATVSIKSAALCVDSIFAYFDQRYRPNSVISLKGDAFYFRKAGFKASPVFLAQNQSMQITPLDKLIPLDGVTS